MVVMGHHGSLLPLHFAERILTAVCLKHLRLKHIGSYLYIVLSQNKSERTTAATSRSTISHILIRENKSTLSFDQLFY